VRVHGQSGLELSVAKNLDGELFAVNDSGFLKNLRRDGGLAEAGKSFDIHDRVFLAEDIGETALRKTPMQGIWPPSKPRISVNRCASAGPYVRGQRSCPCPIHAAAYALLVARRFFGARMLDKFMVLLSLETLLYDLNQMRYLRDHAANGWGVRAFDDLVQPRKA
jgi:hypothetical protein